MDRTTFIDYGRLGDVHITLPDKLVRLDLVEPDQELFWAYDTVEGAVAISPFKDQFVGDDRFSYLDSTKVTPERVTAIPETVRREYSGFEPETPLYFVTTERLFDDRISWIGSDLEVPEIYRQLAEDDDQS